MTEVIIPPAFFAEGVCGQTDPELFYPEKGQSPRPAKELCAGCPVRVRCLQWALDTGQWQGVWGGLSVRERRRLVKKDQAV